MIRLQVVSTPQALRNVAQGWVADPCRGSGYPGREATHDFSYPEGVALWTCTVIHVDIIAWLNLSQISSFTLSSQPKNGASFLRTRPIGPQCTAILVRSLRALIAR